MNYSEFLQLFHLQSSLDSNLSNVYFRLRDFSDDRVNCWTCLSLFASVEETAEIWQEMKKFFSRY